MRCLSGRRKAQEKLGLATTKMASEEAGTLVDVGLERRGRRGRVERARGKVQP